MSKRRKKNNCCERNGPVSLSAIKRDRGAPFAALERCSQEREGQNIEEASFFFPTHKTFWQTRLFDHANNLRGQVWQQRLQQQTTPPWFWFWDGHTRSRLLYRSAIKMWDSLSPESMWDLYQRGNCSLLTAQDWGFGELVPIAWCHFSFGLFCRVEGTKHQRKQSCIAGKFVCKCGKKNQLSFTSWNRSDFFLSDGMWHYFVGPLA